MSGPRSAAPPFDAVGVPVERRAAHFRAFERRRVRLVVSVVGQRSGFDRQATVVDVSVAGAGIETDEPLVPGDRVAVAFATPTLWDPLVLTAVVAWAQPPRASREVDALGRPRIVARAGLAFDYPSADPALAMYEMLASLDYE